MIWTAARKSAPWSIKSKRNAEDGGDQGQGAVHGVAQEHHADRAGQGHEGAHGIDGPSRGAGQVGDGQEAHQGTSPGLAAPGRLTGRTVLTPTPFSSAAATSRTETSKSAGTSAAWGSDWPA